MAVTSEAQEPQRSRGWSLPAYNTNPHMPWAAKFFLLMVMLPVAVWMGSVYMTGLRAYLLIVIVPLMIQFAMGKFGRIYLFDYLIFAYALWTTISIGVNAPSRVVEFSGSTNVEVLGGYLVGRAFIRNAASFEAMTRFLGIVVALMLPLAIIETQTGRPVLLPLLESAPVVMPSFKDVAAGIRLGMERAQVIFAHPIHFGLFCSAAFSLTIVGLSHQMSRGPRLFLGTAVGLSCFLSLSSGAILALLMQLGLIAWSVAFSSVKRKWLMLFLFFAAIWIAVDIGSNRSPVRVFLSYATFSAHNAFWRATIFEYGMINVWNNPIFGLGFRDWFRPSWMRGSSVDNFWLMTPMRYGIPSFLLLAGAFVSLFWHVARRDFSQDERLNDYRRAWLFVMSAMVFSLATVHIWTSMFSFAFFLTASGAWFCYAEPAGASAISAADTAGTAQRRPSAPRLTRFPPAEEGQTTSATARRRLQKAGAQGKPESERRDQTPLRRQQGLPLRRDRPDRYRRR